MTTSPIRKPGSIAPAKPVKTMWGDGFVSRGTFAGAEVLHVSRHEEGHLRLSNHVTHLANLAALKQLGITDSMRARPIPTA